MDRCTPQQRHLRALLALGWFNSDLDTVRGRWCAYGLTSYTLLPSPTDGELRIWTNWAEGAVRWLVPGGDEWPFRIPGLRLEATDGRIWRLRHLPTQAVLTVVEGSGRGRRRPAQWVDPQWIRPTTAALTDVEADQLGAVPAMTSAASELLAALPVRMALRDPRGEWAIGGWWGDPLDRPQQRSVTQALRRLDGAGDRWELAWTGYPFPDDLAIALSHPTVGLSDTHRQRTRTGWDIHHNGAVLTLRSLE
ncbi:MULTISPECIES: hypothetical protein [unclassified Streptomyces]|uniref:hypothetical protein n=1 Tax=unclassified Streptomyces TaxID=2593676 RepID=UPI000DB9FC9E|nr:MULTISPECIES: hypothetical protein [unclassified Streptomyces]MYT68316.1 hypothetical protein [Streptomyces sp. SID8367]RAJ76952.1 hypothetical protein K377_06121 [Streptomyces sp. PsTaAH-137]